MKQVYALALVTALATSCSKDESPLPHNPQQPEMIYTDLHNRELKYQQGLSIDLNHDELADIDLPPGLLAIPLKKKMRHSSLPAPTNKVAY
ncbi:hypothetical protein [Paraflavitalea speifideaquila]|uniref:hypothetical protein n=1 Tax=Paraflavitalea speifideaquila TaxID=3076558 RepID=UPI0028F14ED0|nr:hypothetical protein [Paraflavitalea speifideiaquila]